MKHIFLLCAFSLMPLAAQAYNPVRINVDANPKKDQLLNYNFTPIAVNQLIDVDFVLTNVGEAPVTIKSVSVFPMEFQQRSNCPVNISPKQSCVVRAYFQPRRPGGTYGDLQLRFAGSNITVRLFGLAR